MNIAVLLSAGSGSRMKSSLPKQFIEIDNKPLFIYTLKKFFIKEIDKIVLVINEEYRSTYIDYLKKFNIQNIELVSGGNSRQESVYLAVKYLQPICKDDDIIIVHDCARPLVNYDVIINNIKKCSLLKTPISTVTNIVDTIVDKEYNLIDRNNLFKVQTPQTFLYSHIKFIHIKAKEEKIISASDDIQMAKKFGLKIDFVYGSSLNFKITEPDDLKLFELIRKAGDY